MDPLCFRHKRCKDSVVILVIPHERRGLLFALRCDVVVEAQLAQSGGHGRTVKSVLDPFIALGLEPDLDVADGAAGTATGQLIGTFDGRRTKVGHPPR